MIKKQKFDATVEPISCRSKADVARNKHRVSDSKYRNNIQFLFHLLKVDNSKNYTKVLYAK